MKENGKWEIRIAIFLDRLDRREVEIDMKNLIRLIIAETALIVNLFWANLLS